MKQLYPPQPKKEKEIALILAVMDSLFYERKAIYFSVPITTGKNFSHWHAAFGRKYCTSNPKYMKEHRTHVIEPNRTKVREIASEFSKKFRRPLINPMRLQDLPEWTQDDYRVLWGSIIEKYVSAVIFAEKWQYSNGCAYEFFTAQRNRIPTLDEQQSNLTLNKGIRLIDSAIRRIKSQCRKAPTEFLENVKQELVHLKEMNCTK